MKCYTTSELRHIAITFVKKQECDTLLRITNHQLKLKMEIVADQDAKLVLLNKESVLKEGIIANKQAQITSLTDDLKKAKRRNVLLGFTLGGTSFIFAGVAIMALLAH